MPLTEKEKMLAGELYRSIDPELQSAAAQAQEHLRCLNAMPNEDLDLRRVVVRNLPSNVLAVGNPCSVIRDLS